MNDIVFVDALNELNSTVCVVRWLLVAALRTGNVHGTRVEEVLRHATARADKTIQ